MNTMNINIKVTRLSKIQNNCHWEFCAIHAGRSVACKLQNMHLPVNCPGLPAAASLALVVPHPDSGRHA